MWCTYATSRRSVLGQHVGAYHKEKMSRWEKNLPVKEVEEPEYYDKDTEEDYDMIFDKVTVYSHVNAPGGR